MSKLSDAGISWVIVGQCTPVKASTQPKIEWVRDIVEAADKAGVPVFLKNNLYSLWYNEANDGSKQIPIWATGHTCPLRLRQEFFGEVKVKTNLSRLMETECP